MMKLFNPKNTLWEILIICSFACQTNKALVTVKANDQYKIWSLIMPDDHLSHIDTTRLPVKYQLLTLNLNRAKARLKPLESQIDYNEIRFDKNTKKTITFDLPLDDGSFKTFIISNSNIMSHELANKFPDIRSFRGYAKDNEAIQVRMDVNPKGLFAMITAPEKTIFIKPADKSQDFYLSYDKKDTRTGDREFQELPVVRPPDQ